MLWKCAAMAKHTIVHTRTATAAEARQSAMGTCCGAHWRTLTIHAHPDDVEHGGHAGQAEERSKERPFGRGRVVV